MPPVRATKKPVTITTIQFIGTQESFEEIVSWMVSAGYPPAVEGRVTFDEPYMKIPTLENKNGHIADPRDYIIRGVKDEFYPCKPDIFQQTYDLE